MPERELALVAGLRERFGAPTPLPPGRRREAPEGPAARPAPEAWTIGEDCPPARCVHDLIREQAARAPDALAIIDADGERLSCAEVVARAERLAAVLVARGVRRGARVGVCLEGGADRVVGVLAVGMAGGAFVPIDPGQPEERVAFVLDDADVAVLLVDRAGRGRLPEGRWPRVRIDELPSVGEAEPAAVVPSDLAYVVYTSGSTGRPKGVMIEHGALYNTLAASQRAHPLRPGERFLASPRSGPTP